MDIVINRKRSAEKAGDLIATSAKSYLRSWRIAVKSTHTT